MCLSILNLFTKVSLHILKLVSFDCLAVAGSWKVCARKPELVAVAMSTSQVGLQSLCYQTLFCVAFACCCFDYLKRGLYHSRDVRFHTFSQHNLML